MIKVSLPRYVFLSEVTAKVTHVLCWPLKYHLVVVLPTQVNSP